MPTETLGDRPMTNARRQARYRIAWAAAQPGPEAESRRRTGLSRTRRST
jgi:hypothetical protein